MDTTLILIVVFCGVLVLATLARLSYLVFTGEMVPWVIKVAAAAVCIVATTSYLAALNWATKRAMPTAVHHTVQSEE